MYDPALLTAYIVACAVLVLVPGPTVTVIIANSLRHGARAGLLNVLGTQIGLAAMIAVLAAGLGAAVALFAGVFEIVRILGAAYLIWLGIRLWRSDGSLGQADPRARPFGSFVVQGIIVIWSNPKALLFFGAFIPQFVDPAANATVQIAVLGILFMVVATIFDSLYAVAAGGAGKWLSRARIRLTERIAGTFMIGGGLWLLLARR